MLLVLALLLAAPAVPASRLVVGLASPLGPERAKADARLLAAHLTTALGRTVEARPYDTPDELASALTSGRVDVGWLTPIAYVRATRQLKLAPLLKAVRRGHDYYLSALFVRADSGIARLSQAAGKKVAWVRGGSATGYVYPLAFFKRHKVDPDLYFARPALGADDHKAECELVLSGKADVGATFADAEPTSDWRALDGCIESVGEAEAKKLLPIEVLDRPIPSDVIVARPGLPMDDAKALAGALVALATDDAGRKLLAELFHAERLVPASDDDFGPVREAEELALGKAAAK